MSTRAELPVKLYYRIGEVAEVVGVEPHVLRYWESEFGAIRPQKSPKGQRVYSRRDLEKLLRVKALLYEEGYTIAGAKKRLREPMVTPTPAPVAQVAASTQVEEVAPLVAQVSLSPELEQHRVELERVRFELRCLRAELSAELEHFEDLGFETD